MYWGSGVQGGVSSIFGQILPNMNFKPHPKKGGVIYLNVLVVIYIYIYVYILYVIYVIYI